MNGYGFHAMGKGAVIAGYILNASRNSAGGLGHIKSSSGSKAMP